MYFDDILVTGENEERHLASLTEVLDRLKQSGLRLKHNKCRFLAPASRVFGL